MILKKVHFPILYLVLMMLVGSCKKEVVKKATNYQEFIAKGNAFSERQHLDSAYFYYNLAKESCNNATDLKYTYVLYQLANAQQMLGDYYGAEETVTQALTNEKDTLYKPYLYNILAIAYDKQKNFDGALTYYQKQASSTSDKTLKAVTQNNIGVIYIEKKEYQKALQTFLPLLTDKILNHPKNKNELARVLDNLGYTQFKLQLPEALSNLSKALQIRNSLHDDLGLISSNIHLAEYYKELDKQQSLKYATDAMAASKKVKNPDDQLEALYFLIANSNPKSTKAYSLNYIALNDSISNARAADKRQFAKIRYDSSTALKNLEIQKGQKLLFLILLFSAIAIGTISYFYIRNRNRNRLKTISYETETRIAKKLHDELANDVYQTMAFAETQDLEQPAKKETLLNSLDKIYLRTRNISKENSSIPTGDKFEEMLKEMLASYISEQVNVIVKNPSSVNWAKLPPEKQIVVYRVLQELLVNMKKHSRATLVVIGFETVAGDIEIQYHDNGIGNNNLLKFKNGLRNAENRMQTINGTITFDSAIEKGFRAKMNFPR